MATLEDTETTTEQAGPTKVTRTLTYEVYYKDGTPEEFLRFEDHHSNDELDCMTLAELALAEYNVVSVVTTKVEKNVEPPPVSSIESLLAGLGL